MRMSPQLKGYSKIAKKAGWTIEQTRNGHIRFRPPYDWKGRHGESVAPLVTGSTPSDRRSELNFRAYLRRSGLEV